MRVLPVFMSSYVPVLLDEPTQSPKSKNQVKLDDVIIEVMFN